MTDICGICQDTVADDHDALCCDKCERWSHRQCLNMSKTTYKKLEKSTSAWNCDPCKKKEENRTNNKTNNRTKTNCSNDDIMAKLMEMDDKYNNLWKKYEEQMKINRELQKEICEIKKQLNSREQQELNNNVVVQGIPFKEQEKVEMVVQKLADCLKVANNTESSFRMGERKEGKANPIKISFKNADDKKKWMIAKKAKEITLKDLGLQQIGSENQIIYINHDLTKENISLFKAAKEYKNNKGYKFLWISDGKILMRKTENSKVELIDSVLDLKN